MDKMNFYNFIKFKIAQNKNFFQKTGMTLRGIKDILDISFRNVCIS